MTQIKFYAPVKEMNGEFEKGSGIIMRKKKSSEERQKTLELRAELENFKNRFYAQFKRPDPEAPYEKKPELGSMKLRQKQYSKLDNFIQAIIRQKLENAN